MPGKRPGCRKTTRFYVGARHVVPLQNCEQFGKPTKQSIPTIIRSFKSAVTNQINQIPQIPGASVWQHNYYEHIIRITKFFYKIIKEENAADAKIFLEE